MICGRVGATGLVLGRSLRSVEIKLGSNCLTNGGSNQPILNMSESGQTVDGHLFGAENW